MAAAMHRLRTLTNKLTSSTSHAKLAVFATPLPPLIARDTEKHGGQVAKDGFAIPWILRLILDYLALPQVIVTEGIFRMAGFSKIIKDMRADIDKAGTYNLADLATVPDVHNVSSVLKLFIREIPGGLIPEQCAESLTRSGQQASVDYTNLRLRLHELPKANLDILNYLCRFLIRVAEHAGDNKMTIPNLVIVFGPSLVKFSDATLASSADNILKQSFQANKLLDSLLQDYSLIFDEIPELDPLNIDYAVVKEQSPTKLTIDVAKSNTYIDHRTWFDSPKSAPLAQSTERLLSRPASKLSADDSQLHRLGGISPPLYPTPQQLPASQTVTPTSSPPRMVTSPPEQTHIAPSQSTHNLKDIINASVSSSLLTAGSPPGRISPGRLSPKEPPMQPLDEAPSVDIPTIAEPHFPPPTPEPAPVATPPKQATAQLSLSPLAAASPIAALPAPQSPTAPTTGTPAITPLSPEQLSDLKKECRTLALRAMAIQQEQSQGLPRSPQADAEIARLQYLKDLLRAHNALPLKKVANLQVKVEHAHPPIRPSVDSPRTPYDIMLAMDSLAMAPLDIEQERKELKHLLNELRPHSGALRPEEQLRLKKHIQRYKLLRERCGPATTPSPYKAQHGFNEAGAGPLRSPAGEHFDSEQHTPKRKLYRRVSDHGEEDGGEGAGGAAMSPEYDKENRANMRGAGTGAKAPLDEGQLAALQSQKQQLRARLLEYEDEFKKNYGRPLQTEEDKRPIAKEYRRYLRIKEILREANRDQAPAHHHQPRSAQQ
ncbi:Protein fam13b [Sorochytrium milnesiophthora]